MEKYQSRLDDIELFVLNYHYPFIFDLDCKEDMVNVRQKLKLANPLTKLTKLAMLLSVLSGGEVDGSLAEGLGEMGG